MTIKPISKFFLFILPIFLICSCGGNEGKKNASDTSKEVKKEVVKTTPPIDITKAYMDDKGVGPIKTIMIPESINTDLANEGLELYKTYCTACHKLKKKYIGPALHGISKRRSPEWIMNMIMNPEEMLKKNELAKALIAEYNAPMANQQIKKEDARAILEFLRLKDNE